MTFRYARATEKDPMKQTEHAKRVKAGRCVRCSLQARDGSVFCRKHRKVNRETVRWYRAQAVAP